MTQTVSLAERYRQFWRWFALAALVCSVVAGLGLFVNQGRYQLAAVVIDGRTNVTVKVADSPKKQARGLSIVDRLADDEGMLFVFPQPSDYGFWMKGMTFPIDIIWLKDGKIVDIMVDLPPQSDVDGQLPIYRPRVAVTEVLEVPAGFSARHGLKIGMPVEYRIDTN